MCARSYAHLRVYKSLWAESAIESDSASFLFSCTDLIFALFRVRVRVLFLTYEVICLRSRDCTSTCARSQALVCASMLEGHRPSSRGQEPVRIGDTLHTNVLYYIICILGITAWLPH